MSTAAQELAGIPARVEHLSLISCFDKAKISFRDWRRNVSNWKGKLAEREKRAALKVFSFAEFECEPGEAER